jgi:predicted nucleotidyltransferase component of viral defense system
MINIDQLLPFYPEPLRMFKRFILREYLQCKILEIVFNSRHAHKLIFLGGTCLRLVHNNQRFSEDLDFDNLDLTEAEFNEISTEINAQLQRLGYTVETRTVARGAFHCYIKFPGMLLEQKLSGFAEERILIQLDTEPQHFDFAPESVILNRFDVFTRLNVTPLDVLMAQKCYAILNRPRNKGRDFFDLVFLMGLDIRPNEAYIQAKLNISNRDDLVEALLAKCDSLNFKEMTRDVAPFLFNQADNKRVELFSEYLKSKRL